MSFWHLWDVAGRTLKALYCLNCHVVVGKCSYVTELLTQLAPPHPTTIFLFSFLPERTIHRWTVVIQTQAFADTFSKMNRVSLSSRGRWPAVFVACDGVELSLRIENSRNILTSTPSQCLPGTQTFVRKSVVMLSVIFDTVSWIVCIWKVCISHAQVKDPSHRQYKWMGIHVKVGKQVHWYSFRFYMATNH